MWAFVGLVPCSGAPQQWSEGVLVVEEGSRTPSMFCLRQASNQEPCTSQPRLATD